MVQVKAAFRLNACVAQGGLGVGFRQQDSSGIDGMVVGFGHDAAGRDVKVVEREVDVDTFPIIAGTDFNGLHIFLSTHT
jgi:hypothetical protein